MALDCVVLVRLDKKHLNKSFALKRLLHFSALVSVQSCIATWSWDSTKIPDNFNRFTVTKKAEPDIELLYNNQPVRNLAFVAEIIEKVVAQQLTSYLQENNLNGLTRSVIRYIESEE